MYILLKKIARKLLPKNLLFHNEETFRRLLLLVYQGNKAKCTVCGSSLKKFEVLENGDLLCPICGSLPRTRRLWTILNKDFLKPNICILDFSPSRAIFRELKKRKEIQYFPTDFENEFLADYRFDITKIEAKDETFDIIVCYHILEHIEDDESAMNELFRVLKNDGVCLIQTPFKEGNIYEDFSIKTKEQRLLHFGQDDHVRIYSVAGLQERLQKAGFKAEIKTFAKNDYFGFSDNETILFCSK